MTFIQIKQNLLNLYPTNQNDWKQTDYSSYHHCGFAKPIGFYMGFFWEILEGETLETSTLETQSDETKELLNTYLNI